MRHRDDVKINKPFAAALSNMFMNGRGQLALNLDTSKSPLALQVKEKRQAEAEGYKSVEQMRVEKRQAELRAKLEELEIELKKLVKERDEVLKEGVRIPQSAGFLRSNKFRKANTLLKAIRELKANIILLKKEL